MAVIISILLSLLVIVGSIVAGIMFIVTLSRVASKVQPENRDLTPGSVWLLLVPLFNIVWIFIMNNRLSSSLHNEFEARGIATYVDRPTYGYGLWYGILTVFSLVMNLVFQASAGAAIMSAIETGELPAWYTAVQFIYIGAAGAGLVAWIAYWIAVSDYGKMLDGGDIAETFYANTSGWDRTVKIVGKYFFPIFLIVIGIAFLWKFLKHSMDVALPDQPGGLFLGGMFLTIGGIVALPIVQAKIGRKLALGMGIVFAAASAWLYYGLYSSIDQEIAYLDELERRTKGVAQSLKDIRSAQEAYASVNGHYTDNFDTLIQFVQEPLIAMPFKVGDALDDSIGGGRLEAYIEQGYVIKQDEVDSVAQMLGMTHDQLWSMIEAEQIVYKIRDTSYVSFYDENFADDVRRAKDLPLINLETLPYQPFDNVKFVMDTSSVEVSGLRRSTVRVKDPRPFGRENVNMKRDTLMFGSLTEAHTDGNWKQEE